MPKKKDNVPEEKKDTPDVVAVDVEQLKPNEYNPNQQNVEAFDLLVKSMEADGFTLPVLVNNGKSHPHLKDMIVDGEHRWRAALVLGIPQVPVIYVDFDEVQMKTATIRHNTRGHHDVVLEAEVLKELVADVGDQNVREQLNIDPVELNHMLEKAKDFTDVMEVAEGEMGDELETLEGQNLVGEHARVVAQRHAAVGVLEETKHQDNKMMSKESGQQVRIEFVYSGGQSDIMRKAVAKFGGAREMILQLIAPFLE